MTVKENVLKDIHPELKPFFEKAKKKGWKQGQHLFNFIDETDMIRYDNIKEKLVREEERQKTLEEVEKLKNDDDFWLEVEGGTRLINQVIYKIVEKLKGGEKG